MPLEGVAELDRKLAELGKAVSGKVLRGAVRAGGNVVKQNAQARIRVGKVAHRTYKGRLVTPGFAKRSVRVVTKLDRTGEKASAAIGVRKEAYYAALFLELGTAKMAAQPWLRPALESTQEAQLKAVRDRLRSGIERAARARR